MKDLIKSLALAVLVAAMGIVAILGLSAMAVSYILIILGEIVK